MPTLSAMMYAVIVVGLKVATTPNVISTAMLALTRASLTTTDLHNDDAELSRIVFADSGRDMHRVEE